MIIRVKTALDSYNIYLERGALNKVDELFNLNRKVLVVTDSGVPSEYSAKVASKCKEAVIVTFEQGEKSKNLDTFKMLLEKMVENNFTRTDCVVAVGGGVVGDLSGFASSASMLLQSIPTDISGMMLLNFVISVALKQMTFT